MANRAVIAGSFDPITYGHLDIIRRASKVFSEVFIAIGTNPDKKYTFPVSLRIQMIKNAIDKLPYKNIYIKEFDGLLAQFTYHNNINVIVRGIRNVSDMESELVLAKANKELKDIETFFIPASPDFLTVSSSVCKVIVKENGNTVKYTTIEAKYNLEKAISNNIFIGVTGGIGCGKSYICDKIISYYEFVKDVKCIHLNLDKIGHSILNGTEPFALNVKRQLTDYFGDEILEEDGITVNRKILGKKVLSSENSMDLKVLDGIMKKPMEHATYEFISQKSKKFKEYKKVFLIEGAVMESDWLTLVNNNVIHIDSNLPVRIGRISKRDGLNEDDITNRIASQASSNETHNIIISKINIDGSGNYWFIDNSEESISSDFTDSLEEIYEKIIK